MRITSIRLSILFFIFFIFIILFFNFHNRLGTNYLDVYYIHSPIYFFCHNFFNFHNRLGTNYLDAYYIHSPLATPAQRAKVWEEMAKLKKEGLIRACGVV